VKLISIDDAYVEGAVSLEHGDGWVQPWRLPFDRRDLFVSPQNVLLGQAQESSGVRLRFQTDSIRLGLAFLPLTTPPVNAAHAIDLTIDGTLIASRAVAQNDSEVLFEALPNGSKVVEVWLPQDSSIRLVSLSTDDDAVLSVASDERPKWVTYGSSLTHCRRAHSPARTWPAVVARREGWNLTSLGYGGNCCLEPLVGMMIRDLPADLISLKLGINAISGALSRRTFAAAVMGLVQIIREKHRDTPIALISPIAYPPNETQPNVVGVSIGDMRTDIEDVVHRLKKRGDEALYYVNGLDLFNVEEIARYSTDQCHPNGDGIEWMAEHFLARVRPRFPPLVRAGDKAR